MKQSYCKRCYNVSMAANDFRSIVKKYSRFHPSELTPTQRALIDQARANWITERESPWECTCGRHVTR